MAGQHGTTDAQPDIIFGPSQSQFERNPVTDAEKVVERLVRDGTVDKQHKLALRAMQNDEKLRAAVQEQLRAAGHLGPGKTFASEKEREQFARDFTDKNGLLNLGREALYRILTDDSDQHGLAAEHKLLVQQALLSVLEDEEMQRQIAFRTGHQQEFQREQHTEM